MYSNTPPVPPPKPGSHEASRMSTPQASTSPRPPPHPEVQSSLPEAAGGPTAQAQIERPQEVPDPGDQWLPRFLQDKSKHDLADMLSSSELLSALTHSPETVHASLASSHASLQAALADNVRLAEHLRELEGRLGRQRAALQAQLLGTHATERQWRAKQGDMDAALAPFSPARLYQRLAAGVAEQEAVCLALEESFLEGGGGSGARGGGGGGGEERGGPGGDGGGSGVASEREAADWVRRYREAKKQFYLRQERKERWDEGRVGGWR